MRSFFNSKNTGKIIKVIGIHFVLGIFALFTITPIFWMVISSLKTPSEVFEIPPKLNFKPTLHNYEVLLGFKVGEEFEGVRESDYRRVRSKFPVYILNTIVISLFSSLLAVSIGSLAAYGLARFHFKGRSSILFGILLTKVIPPIAILIPMYTIMRKIHLLDTHLALIISYLTFNLPFVVWTMRSFFIELPLELEDSALIDGCSRIGAYFRIILPLAVPGLVASVIFCIVLSWNEFLYAIILTGERARTLAPAIAGFLTDKAILWGRLFAGGAIVVLPVILFAFFIHRKLASGLTLGAVKG
jgi:multiple sugar transport system permease protein